MRILVTGATGYIGGRLVPSLVEAGHEVRCMSRRPDTLTAQPWAEHVEAVYGDILEPDSLRQALDGCDAAYYLVHSMGGGKGFVERDRTGAENFVDAADVAGIERVVYLGGIVPTDTSDLSKHLSSREEVGRILRDAKTDTTEVRAAVIIGSGSLSFEMLRYLTEVLPVMVTPRWVRTECQPAAVRDVLANLMAAVEDEAEGDRIVEVGGPDIMTYQEMMRIYAEEAGLRKRLVIPVPVLTPGLSSRWVGLITPLPSSIARPLVDSLRNRVVVTDPPDPPLVDTPPLPFREAVRKAMEKATVGPETRWSDAARQPAAPAPGDPEWSGGTVYEDSQEVITNADPEHVFWAVSRIGGHVGYYGLSWAWRLRGLLDQLVGGVGLRRGRRHPEDLRLGDAVDFWRVDALERNRLVRLRAEMRLPGRAWLQWQIEPTDEGTLLRQSALYAPKGLWGRLYWLAVLPFHWMLFPRMARRIAATAEERAYTCR